MRLPPGARASDLEIGDETFVVISVPIGSTTPSDLLTPAEAEVASLVIEGLSNAAIAERRGTSVRTIANQMAAILRKLGLASRRELAARWTL